jgi:peptide-methionine (R)-S-oxide reductase
VTGEKAFVEESLQRKKINMKHIIFITFLLFFEIVSCMNGSSNSKTSSKIMAQSQHPENPYYSRTDTAELNLPDSVWKKVLPDSVYEVARNKETERAFTGKYWNYEGLGTYYCAACGNALFRSDAKFASTCGWPSFFETVRASSVKYVPDNSYGMERTEVLCGRCGGHLGHLFNDGPPPSHKRYCMNSIVLDFEPDIKK